MLRIVDNGYIGETRQYQIFRESDNAFLGYYWDDKMRFNRHHDFTEVEKEQMYSWLAEKELLDL